MRCTYILFLWCDNQFTRQDIFPAKKLRYAFPMRTLINFLIDFYLNLSDYSEYILASVLRVI